MGKALTDIGIRNLKPAAVRREVPDGGARGLYIYSAAQYGATGFAVRYRFAGKPRKLTLQAGISLAAARKAAADALFEVQQGRDPAALKLAAKRAQRLAAQDTVRAVATEWLRREGLRPEEKRLRSLRWRELVFERSVYPAIGDRPIADVGFRARPHARPRRGAQRHGDGRPRAGDHTGHF